MSSSLDIKSCWIFPRLKKGFEKRGFVSETCLENINVYGQKIIVMFLFRVNSAILEHQVYWTAFAI